MKKDKGFINLEVIALVPVFIIVVLLTINMYQHATGITSGEIYKKSHEEASVTDVPVMVGNIMTLIPQNNPEEWTIYIEKEGKTNSFLVSKKEYNELNIGDQWVKN